MNATGPHLRMVGQVTACPATARPRRAARLRGIPHPLGQRLRLERYDGTHWSTALDVPVSDIHGAGVGDIWFATAAGPVHYNGTSFVSVPIPEGLIKGKFNGVYALGGGAVLGICDYALLQYHGSWSVAYTPPAGWRVASVAGSGRDDLWLVQEPAARAYSAALMHFDGNRWAPVRALDSIGNVATRGQQTWLASAGEVIHLGSTEPPIAVDRLTIGANLWIGQDAIWLNTDKVARRHPLP